MYSAIAANKRNTLLIMAVFVALISAIGYVISLYFGNTSVVYWVIGGAAIYAFIQYFAASSLAVAMSGAQEIEKKDNPRLFRIVENLAITIGIPTPRIYIIDDPAPNAFATGRDPKHAIVAATTGILEIMDDRELESVMAHEMGHVENYDIRVSMIAFGLVSAIGILADIVMRMIFFGDNRRDNNLNPIVLVFGLIVVILSPIIAAIVQLAISRQREYLADATSVITTHDSEGMIDALKKLETYGRPMQKQNTSAAHMFLNDPLKPGFLSRLFSTHPPLPERIKGLNPMPRTSKKKPFTNKERFLKALKKPFIPFKGRVSLFMARRPHRSFRLTKRRNYKRSLILPGYIAFTRSVNKTLKQHKKTFMWLAIIYAILTSVLVGIGSQDTYSTLLSTLQSTGSQIFQGNLGQVGQAALLFVTIGTSGISATPTDAQQIYIVILGLLIWLTTVWLLRNLLANHKVKMRDGLYNAGAPIISTVLLVLVFVLQLIPLGLAVIGYSAASASGLLNGGVAAMLFWFVAALLTIMSLYWVTSTFFALIIVTLPGMYPMKALRTAGDMLIGRRIRVLLRILWMFLIIFLSGAIVLIPTILIDTWLISLWPAVANAPIVPIVLMLFSVVSFIWGASYIYLLYRKVVDDDAKPA